uniref:thiamine diphosphokinase n=1 Tax=Eubacterium sp. TaxID=142586 RepID=UPI004028C069
PNLIIGDFDSSKKPGNDVNILQLPSIKNDTDTFYCIKEAVKRKADEIDIFCALGGRTDHELSNILNLEYCLENNVKASIISEKCVISVHNKNFEISKGEYKYFSLFAIGGSVSGLSIKGAAYELEDFTLSPYASIGQSNEFKNNTVSIEFKNGVLLLILSND